MTESNSDGTIDRDAEAREVRIPLRLVNRSLRNALAGFGPRLKLDSKTGCAIRFVGPAAKDFGLKPMEFTLAPFKKWIWTAHLRDLNTKVGADGALAATISIEPGNARYRNGFVQLVVALEEDGRELEISWAPEAELAGLRLTATIGLGVDDGVPVPEDVDVHLPVKLDLNNLPDGLLDGLVGYSGRLQRMIEGKCLEYAENPQVLQTIKRAIAPKLQTILPTGTLTELRVDAQFVRLRYQAVTP